MPLIDKIIHEILTLGMNEYNCHYHFVSIILTDKKDLKLLLLKELRLHRQWLSIYRLSAIDSPISPCLSTVRSALLYRSGLDMRRMGKENMYGQIISWGFLGETWMRERDRQRERERERETERHADWDSKQRRERTQLASWAQFQSVVQKR